VWRTSSAPKVSTPASSAAASPPGRRPACRLKMSPKTTWFNSPRSPAVSSGLAGWPNCLSLQSQDSSTPAIRQVLSAPPAAVPPLNPDPLLPRRTPPARATSLPFDPPSNLPAPSTAPPAKTAAHNSRTSASRLACRSRLCSRTRTAAACAAGTIIKDQMERAARSPALLAVGRLPGKSMPAPTSPRPKPLLTTSLALRPATPFATLKEAAGNSPPSHAPSPRHVLPQPVSTGMTARLVCPRSDSRRHDPNREKGIN